MIKSVSRWAVSMCVILPVITHATSLTPEQTDLANKILSEQSTSFASPEHQDMGNNLRLRTALGETVAATELDLIVVTNGVKAGIGLTYGDIVALSGDFIATDKPLINGTPDNLNQRAENYFQEFFKTEYCKTVLGKSKSSATAISEYLGQFEQERVWVKDGQLQGKKAWQVYKERAGELNQKLNRISCGGSPLSGYVPFGKYIKLASQNTDHFQPQAKQAYLAMHKLALDYALQGYQAKQALRLNEASEYLKKAYAANAMGGHFLTDNFSSGHMRVPRKELHDGVLMPEVLSLLMSNFMHNEDNHMGLCVRNAMGTTWRAFGDGLFDEPENQMSKMQLMLAMQASVDAVYAVFDSGQLPSTHQELQYFPTVSEDEGCSNHAALFKLENKKVLIRKKLNDPYDYNWTANWIGMLSLLALELSYQNEAF